MKEHTDPKLKDLDARIRAAQRSRKPDSDGEGGRSSYAGLEFAWRMIIDLVAGVGVGCGIGYGLDSLFGSLPVFLILFALLGFAAGVRVMVRSANEYQAKMNASETVQDKGKGPEGR